MHANFSENYSSPTLQGSHLGEIDSPDKTRVGWWKNGYPEYFAKVSNSVNWIGIKIALGEKVIDLYNAEFIKFSRVLDTKKDLLQVE